jgi:phenylacetate-CoA ligase
MATASRDFEREQMPRAMREAHVLSFVQHQLRYVYENLPFYRRHYDSHGFHPDHVRSLSDFTARVPIITKSMLRDDQSQHPPFGTYLGVPRDCIVRVHGSSGTTGKPTLYAFSRHDWDYTTDVMARAFSIAGVRSGDIVQLATVFSLFMGGWGALVGCEALQATAFPIGAGETERQIELMHRIGSTVLVTTPTYALHMLEVARELGYDTTASPLRLGIFIGEPGAAIPATRQMLADGWGIQVRDMATTSEMTPWGTNVECSAGNGVHVLQDEVWTEIVDKDDPAKAVPEGESGGVIYTHLRRDSQPMIRFFSGDESRISYEPCPCGRTYPRLPEGIYGRLDDMLIVRGANVYPSQVQRCLLEVPGTGMEFAIFLDRVQSLDRVLVRVEYDPAATASEAFRYDLARRVRHKLKNEININFDVEILEPYTLERAVSKAKRVFDHRGSQTAPMASSLPLPGRNRRSVE